MRAQPAVTEPPAHVRKCLGVDDARTQLGQVAFGPVGMAVVELLGDGQAQHRVAEKLQPLIGWQTTVLIRVTAVGQRDGEQLRRKRHTQSSQQILVTITHESPPAWSSSVGISFASFAQRGSICSC